MEASRDATPAEQMSETAKTLLRRIRSTDVLIGHIHDINSLFEGTVRLELLKPIRADDHSKLANNYRKLACSVARALSENYLNLTLGIRVENFQALLASLSELMMGDVKRALELRIPLPASNLRRNSLGEIQAVVDNLKMHADRKVRDNADAIVRAALNRGNLVYVTEILETDYGQ